MGATPGPPNELVGRQLGQQQLCDYCGGAITGFRQIARNQHCYCSQRCYERATSRRHDVEAVLLRLHRKSAVDPHTGCWVWLGHTNRQGYGVTTWGTDRYYYTHRLACLIWKGGIPDGTEVHHQCHNRACFNPAHLEFVTRAVHSTLMRANARKTHCIHGHEFTPANTFYKRGGRQCRECTRSSNQRTERPRCSYRLNGVRCRARAVEGDSQGRRRCLLHRNRANEWGK
jgi:hypothetical protein